MKKFVWIFSVCIIASVVIFISCSKSITERTQNLAPLDPSKTDVDAGTWKTVLLTAPDEFSVPTPAATNSPAYLADINEIKGWQHNLSEDQKQIVKYWTAGGVLRWNEILRTLVAKHNLPPYQNGD